ncbi:phosphoribosylamine--glycine ligase [Clostridium acidisoli DSM 12555]|uniref:Phosphoribosylamine--glycine ligase n=1 Tax=Clostridium acidisoli DSM 12555 TaxID=1121291 RepID=A0A1W1X6X8_9CLOT|nr:phosphoribosylamine--glycine ligase [Clostridium acidisoli]SMC19488.1 phosphoribosylamine--glycine ligase [Clostridium acidisoli DSM 12555]
MKILVIGNGGREHAIAWKVSLSENVEKVYCAPGNGGMAIENKCENVALDTTPKLLEFAKKENIDLTIVGPEVKLVEGIVDVFKENGLKIFGPGKAAAQLEGSKSFSKDFMKKYGVKTAAYEVFQDVELAKKYAKDAEYPLVVKADGLAAGKGVVICSSYSEAESALNEFMVDDVFKGSGKTVVLEEFLDGVEASILSITDGNVIIPFISAKDHKQIFDNDEGPNTGGMGAIAPNPYCTPEVLKEFDEKILMPTLEGIKKENMDYCGIIFFGIMITKKGTYLLEYNVRMGDPETQAVLPLLISDFTEIILSAIDGKLKDIKIQWKKEAACCLVLASGGYPLKYETGREIKIKNNKSKVFAAGAIEDKGVLKTSGGRVLALVNTAKTLDEAIKATYNDVKNVEFDNMYFRKDIGTLYK